MDKLFAVYTLASGQNYEPHESAEAAIIREKRIKKWNRLWKLRLIEEKNPAWRDLFEEICRRERSRVWIPAYAGMT
jgi:predicted GIY-YIG superfamily endonuclease